MKRIQLQLMLFLCGIVLPFSNNGQEAKLMLKSRFQEDTTSIRSIATAIHPDRPLNIVFVLPVEAQKSNYRFGDPFEACKTLISEQKIADNVLLVQPGYSQVPWYGDHPLDTSKWQMAYTAELIRHVQAQYAGHQISTYLLGFSKSGFGSMSLLLKIPDLIDGVMIWDAPLATGWNDKWKMHHAFGNEKHFLQQYHMLRDTGIDFLVLRNKKIVIGGYDFFEESSTSFLSKLDESRISYIHDSTLNFQHKWNPIWMLGLMKKITGLTPSN